MSTSPIKAVSGLALLLVAFGCEEERELPGRPVCNAWKTEVQPLLQDRCVSCHSESLREGDYALHDYLAAFEPDAQGRPRIEPGSAQSTILTVLDADAVHRELAAVRPDLERWVVTCNARFVKTDLHASGIMQPAHPDFHGALIRDNLYDLDGCRECHGEDLGGGAAEASCLTCHPQGPDDCSTCHSGIIEQGAHQTHVFGGALERPMSCETCHRMPEDLLTPGHVVTAEGTLDPPPIEVRFTGEAIGPGEDDPQPSYDMATARCDNVYCHGGTFDDAAAEFPAPTWDMAGPLDCNDCHGNPPADHPGDQCGRCHLDTVDRANQLADLTLHLDRLVEVGPREAGCGGCHGSDANPAPAPDVDGNTDPRLVSIGLHDAHLNPRLGLNLTVACEECHRVPQAVLEFGHLNGGPAEVFPNVAGVGTLASTDGATPTWDHETATCSNVYCHGAGDRHARDTSESLVPVLQWTDLSGRQIYCGSCHGTPPTTPIHDGITGLDECSRCHPTSVDDFGNIIPNGDHLNGSAVD